MGVYLKEFSTHAEYDAYINGSGAILPNVSICTTEGDVHYNPYVEPVETRLVLTFNVTDTSSPTNLFFNVGGYWGTPYTACTSIEIDGVEQSTVNPTYTFSTTGRHIVKCEFSDPTMIPNICFSGCSNIVDVKVPDIVETIGYSAFTYCGLTSVTFTEDSHLDKIDTGAFRACTGITSVGKFGDGSSVELPSTITTFGGGPFSYNENLLTMVIQENVTKMGNTFFYECTSLQSVTVEAVTPPSLGRDMLYLSNRNAPIYVPAESVSAYKAAAGWKQYPSNIQAIS